MKTFLAALAVALLATATPALAQTGAPTKIGVIDLQVTLNETKVGKQARDRLETQKNDKQKQINDRKEKLKKQAEEFEKQRSGSVPMNPEAVAKRERELQEEYVSLQQTFMQLQQDLAKQEATLTREIFTKAQSIVQDIAKRDGYTIIVEKNEGAVLWAAQGLDITAEVNKRLDAGEGQKTEAPPKGKDK